MSWRISNIHKFTSTSQKRHIDIISEQMVAVQRFTVSNRVAKKNKDLAKQQDTKTREAHIRLYDIRGQPKETLDNLWKSEKKFNHLT